MFFPDWTLSVSPYEASYGALCEAPHVAPLGVAYGAPCGSPYVDPYEAPYGAPYGLHMETNLGWQTDSRHVI